MRKLFLFLPLAIILAGLYGCGYNQMQAKEEAVFAAWGDVEAAYQRRADLVPNLVEVVKGYAKHENETLTAVTEARAKVGTVQVSKEMLDQPDAVAASSRPNRSSARPFRDSSSWPSNIRTSRQIRTSSTFRTSLRGRKTG